MHDTNIPTVEPAEFTVGDTLKFTKAVAGHLPADGWALTYALVMNQKHIALTSSDNGDGTYLVNVAAATTADWPAGEYKWQAYVTKATDRFLAGFGVIKLLPDYATQTDGLDDRSIIKQTLDALEATIKGKASKDQLSYSIAGRSLQAMTPEDLIKWHSHYKTLYRQEIEAMRVANGLESGRIIRTRF